MDDLSKQLEQILNDPGSLNQILHLANTLGIQPPPDLSPEQGSEMASRISQLLDQNQAQEKKQQALVHALLPYLRPGRQVRLERAMQIAHLSHIAGALGLHTVQESKEDSSHV